MLVSGDILVRHGYVDSQLSLESLMSIKTLPLLLILIPHIGVAASDHKWEFTEIHGNTIAWSCEGEGRPTVLLIAGSGLDAHGSFGRIYYGYEGPGKICFYDRAGMGLSTFENPAPKTLDEMANELSALIAHHKWKELVLVPHSFGGMIARNTPRSIPRAFAASCLLIPIMKIGWG